MDKFNHYCFDLDGTLVDSNQTIFKATVYALNKLGINSDIDEKRFVSMIGMHFVDIFLELGVNVPDFDRFIKIYKDNYFEQMEYSVLYSDVEETLRILKESGNKISLLTTKVQDQADRIIDYFNLRKYFDLVMGRRDGINYKPSPDPLLFIINELKADLITTLMVGDTELDIQCGKTAGAKTCGVLYGYRSKESLELQQPDYLVSSISEILTLKKIADL